MPTQIYERGLDRNEANHVPDLYNNRAVDSSGRQLNCRPNGVSLEEALLEIQAKSSNRGD